MPYTPGELFKKALFAQKPLQIVGAVNAFCALLAKQAGHKALYLSGAGVANASLGLPDLGITHLGDVLEDARRILGVTDLPLLVDMDTGWGSSLTIARAVRELEKIGVAAVHIEDQLDNKRCGHRPNKQLASTELMVDRIKAAVDARRNDHFIIMARTDSLAKEGLSSAIDRSLAYKEAGADMLFPEAVQSLSEYESFVQKTNLPVLANITEFSTHTPLFEKDELAAVGVAMILYPLSAFRAMSLSAQKVYENILLHGNQKNMLDQMQTRAELYQSLGYYEAEAVLDQFYGNKNKSS